MEEKTKESIPGHCPECGAKLRRCHLCGSMYCPECDQYHVEECRDTVRP